MVEAVGDAAELFVVDAHELGEEGWHYSDEGEEDEGVPGDEAHDLIKKLDNPLDGCRDNQIPDDPKHPKK